MNGVKFHTCATTRIASAQIGSLSQDRYSSMMWNARSSPFMTPTWPLNIHCHMRPFTMAGIAHGRTSRVRSTVRPRRLEFATRASPSPSRRFRTTVEATNTSVTWSDAQNSEAPVRRA